MVCGNGGSAYTASHFVTDIVKGASFNRPVRLRTIALTGRDGGNLGPLAQLDIQVSHPHMGRIEDLYMIGMHMIGCYFIEAETSAGLGTLSR